MRLHVLFALCFVYSVSIAQSPGEKPIRFEIKNAGILVIGYFDEFSTSVQFDKNNLGQSSISGTAKVKSLQTGIALRDSHLQGRQYFRSDQFPEIVLKSQKISQTRNNNYLGIFELKIKDIYKVIEVPFTIITTGSQQMIDAWFTLNRLDFDLGEKSIILSDEVKVIVQLKL
jgi:polyisoprenoid-binding protein YceI